MYNTELTRQPKDGPSSHPMKPRQYVLQRHKNSVTHVKSFCHHRMRAVVAFWIVLWHHRLHLCHHASYSISKPRSTRIHSTVLPLRFVFLFTITKWIDCHPNQGDYFDVDGHDDLPSKRLWPSTISSSSHLTSLQSLLLSYSSSALVRSISFHISHLSLWADVHHHRNRCILHTSQSSSSPCIVASPSSSSSNTSSFHLLVLVLLLLLLIVVVVLILTWKKEKSPPLVSVKEELKFFFPPFFFFFFFRCEYDVWLSERKERKGKEKKK